MNINNRFVLDVLIVRYILKLYLLKHLSLLFVKASDFSLKTELLNMIYFVIPGTLECLACPEFKDIKEFVISGFCAEHHPH